jgi:8-oxo-dGTP diphosphatase
VTNPTIIYLLRHAKAGDREAWTEPDELRPLTNKGRRQAERLVRTLRDAELARVISSPYVRCVQTVRPLALERGLAIELSDALAEGAPTAAVLSLVEGVSSVPSVLCSHGDVIPAVVLSLAGRGMSLEGPRDWKKASLWALEHLDGRFVRATYVPPPPVDRRPRGD